MATSTLAKSPSPTNSPEPYDGKLIDGLTDLVRNVEKPKPPQPEITNSIIRNSITPTDDERRERNAAMLLSLWALGEQMAEQAFELPHPKPDPLTVALNGFPDVNSSYAYYARGWTVTNLEAQLVAAIENVLPALNHVIDRFGLDIPAEFDTLAEDVAVLESLVRKAKGQ